MKTERSKPYETLKYRKQTEGCWKGGGAKWVMSIKEGSCQDEHWVLYVSNESLGSTPETKTTPYVN